MRVAGILTTFMKFWKPQPPEALTTYPGL